MTRSLLMFLSTCCALLLAGGCGSSNPSGATGTTAASATTAAKSGLIPDGKINYASPPTNARVLSGLVRISYKEIAIEPDTLKVKVGSTIEWINHDAIQHNITSEGGPSRFASKDLGEGGTFQIKVIKPGMIHYECTLHPTTMNGAIEVVT